MRRHILNMSRGKFAVALLLVLSYVPSSPVQARQTSDDQPSSTLTSKQRTARHFESLRKSPPQLLAFLLAMPKGGDLHNHLSGAIYAESYIQWASESGLCINPTTMALLPPPATGCDPKLGQPRSEEHTSELQSRLHLVCRLLLEKKKKTTNS